jgi:hypothetical protein
MSTLPTTSYTRDKLMNDLMLAARLDPTVAQFYQLWLAEDEQSLEYMLLNLTMHLIAEKAELLKTANDLMATRPPDPVYITNEQYDR